MENSTTPQDGKAMPPASDGSVEAEPVAWLVTGDGYEYATLLKEHAEVIAEEEDGVVVPLYRKPTLTDAEREAVERACRVIAATLPYASQRGAGDYQTLRGLLERMK